MSQSANSDSQYEIKEIIDKNTPFINAEEEEYDDEKTRLNVDTSLSIKQSLDIKQEPYISMNTGFRSLDYISLICINILVILWYNTIKFKRSEIFWAVFIFAYISNIDGLQKLIVLILFNIIQYILYLWFCSWDELSFIVFSILTLIMLSIKLIGKLVYKYGVGIQSNLIHQHIHEREPEYKFYKAAKWYNGFELAMLATTVPIFYFDQTRIWGQDWFAVIVVIVLWYHRINDIVSLLYKDCYIREWMKDIQNKHIICDNKKSFEWELKRPIKQYKYQDIVENIIPITYNLLLFIILIIYFIKYDKNEMSEFEFIYGIILTFVIGIGFGYFVYDIYFEAISKGEKTLHEILDEAKENPKLSDLYGTWIIDNNQHCCFSFILKEENIMEVDLNEMHKLAEGCCSYGVIDIYDSCIVGAVQLPLNQIQLRTKKAPFYFKFIQPEAYKFVLHKNGIIKFVPIGDSLTHKLGLARLDSKGWYDLFKNVKHANKYSCFCLGILTKNGTIKRYNRWNTDLDYFYTATKQ